jgi:autotransporter translocation and assembly factor TamB
MDSYARRPRPRRKRRVLRILGRVSVGLVVFVALVVTLALTALKLERPRAFTARTVENALAETFRGRLRIVKLHALGLGGLRADVRVEDPAGRTVLTARGVDVRIGVPSLVAHLIGNRGALRRIDIEAVRVEHAEVRLVDDGTGSPTLARAFESRAPASSTPGEPAPTVKVHAISFRHVWTHGGFGGTPHLDAELRHAAAALGVEPTRVVIRLDRTLLVSRLGPYALDPRGNVSGSLTIPMDARPLDARAVFGGAVADARVDATASYAGGRIDARVLVPELDRRALARFSPDLLPRGSWRSHVTASGKPEDLAVKAELTSGSAAVIVQGVVKSGERLRVVADVDTRDLDASALVRDTPVTSVDARVHLELETGEARLSGRYDVAVSRAVLDGTPIPSPELRGTLEQSGERLTLVGQLEASEPGIDVTARYDVRTHGARGAADVTLDASLKRPRRLRDLASIETSGTLSARAHVAWPEPDLWGRVHARLESLTAPNIRVGKASLELDARGPVADPSGELTASARGVVLPGLELVSVSATLRGRASRATLLAELEGKERERARIRTEVRYTDGALELKDPTVVLGDRSGSIALSARRVFVGSERIEAERVLIDGAGHAEASFTRRGRSMNADLSTERLDIARLLRFAGVRTPFRSLGATLRAHYDERPGARAANVQGNLGDLAFGKVEGGTAALDLTLQGEQVTGTIDSELVRGSRVMVRLKDVAVLSRDAARGDVLGTVQVAGKLDLTGVGPLLASVPSIPLEKATGSVDLDVTYERARLDALPSLSGKVKTHNLSLVGKRELRQEIDTSGEAIETEPAVYKGIDVTADLALSPDTRRSTLDLELRDRRGKLIRLEATAGPWKGVTLAELVREAPDVPLEAHATVERRRLRTLPDMIRPFSLRGAVSLEARLDGTARDPHVVADVRAYRVTPAAQRVEGREPPRVDVNALLDLRRAGGHVEIDVMRADGRAGQAKLAWSGDALRAASDPAALRTMTAKADVMFDRFDLETVPALKNRQLGGIVSGTARVEYGEARRSADVDVQARAVEIGQARLDLLDAKVKLSTEAISGSVVARGEGGSLEAKVDSQVRWPAQNIPELSGGVRATLSAKRFRLASLWPLVSGSVNELDGRLDAELGAFAQGDKITLRGKGRLREGVVQVPSVGQRFHAIEGNIAVEPSTIALRDLRARGLTGGLTGEATVRIDQTLAVKQLDARVNIEENQKIPITLEGVALGDAWGRVEATLVNRPDRTLLTVRMPRLHLEVPDTGGHGVQDLAADDSIRIGVRRSDARFAALPVQPLVPQTEAPKPLEVRIELGPAVSLRKGDQVTAELEGKLVAKVEEQTTVDGEIELKGGSLDVSGKRFEIERGKVRFSGTDPSNPSIFAVARWDSPAGYVVQARYVGTATNGKLTLSSEPPLQENEILNLILFGTPEGSGGGGSTDSASSAVGIAGGTAAKGINRVLNDFTNLDIQARVDTSTGAARPEIVVPITRRLSARVTRAIGEPTPGASPDRTFLTLELRLQRKWALSALFGDRGASALDLIWRHHY